MFDFSRITSATGRFFAATVPYLRPIQTPGYVPVQALLQLLSGEGSGDLNGGISGKLAGYKEFTLWTNQSKFVSLRLA
jgi:hypothetical protein